MRGCGGGCASSQTCDQELGRARPTKTLAFAEEHGCGACVRRCNWLRLWFLLWLGFGAKAAVVTGG